MLGYLDRSIETICRQDLRTFPILTLTGPRQSGKSTLLRHLLPDWAYVNLEDRNLLDFALSDPSGFVSAHSGDTIFDEVQRAPSLLSQLQVAVDQDRRPGRFALSGSNNLLLLEAVSQSLAGRTSVRHLLPFSHHELERAGRAPNALASALVLGGYPPVHQNPEGARAWLDAYLQTYVERDVRLIRNITDLALFRQFLRLAAGRVGQLLDQSSLGNDLGVSHSTVRDWLNLLETSFVAFRLPPYFRNFSKRVVKRPKLYFYDTGLLCRLLDIRSPQDIAHHPFKGAIFENWCISEAAKAQANRGEYGQLYFWRDRSFEVDLLIQKSAGSLAAFELKAGATTQSEFMKGPAKLRDITGSHFAVDPAVVYGGDTTQTRSQGTFWSWKGFAHHVTETTVE